MILKALNFIQTPTFFNGSSNQFNFLSSQFENIIDAIQDNLDNLGVFTAQ